MFKSQINYNYFIFIYRKYTDRNNKLITRSYPFKFLSNERELREMQTHTFCSTHIFLIKIYGT